MFRRKYTGPDSRIGGVDRRYGGRWAKHVWGIILLLVFAGGVGTGIGLRAGDASAVEAIEQAAEGDIARSQVILDSLLAMMPRLPEIQERIVLRDRLVRDTVRLVDTLLVSQDPQIIRVRDTVEVLVVDTVFAPPQIITIPAPEYGFFSSEFFKPRAGNLLYLLGGVALGHLVSSDATACVLVTTAGSLEKNCDPER
jgi:hypothetical protein